MRTNQGHERRGFSKVANVVGAKKHAKSYLCQVVCACVCVCVFMRERKVKGKKTIMIHAIFTIFSLELINIAHIFQPVPWVDTWIFKNDMLRTWLLWLFLITSRRNQPARRIKAQLGEILLQNKEFWYLDDTGKHLSDSASQFPLL